MESINFIYTSFFKHLLLENYLSEDQGNNLILTCKIFKNYLTIYNKYTESNFYKYFEKNDSNIELDCLNITITDIKIIKSYLLLTGYRKVGGGHAITMNIEYIELNNSFTIYIINSGDGLNEVIKKLGKKIKLDYNQKTEAPIIIKFENITDIQMSEILLINKFMFNFSDRQQCIKQFLQINKITGTKKFDQESWNTVKNNNGYFIYDIYKENNEKINGDLFYKFIFNILKGLSPSIVDIGREQVSGTCTFFSIYYYLRYFVFKYTENSSNLAEFNSFILNIKNSILNDLINKVQNLIDTDKLLDHPQIPNICNIVIKDYNFDHKENLTNLIYQIYNDTKYSLFGIYNKRQLNYNKDNTDLIINNLNNYTENYIFLYKKIKLEFLKDKTVNIECLNDLFASYDSIQNLIKLESLEDHKGYLKNTLSFLIMKIISFIYLKRNELKKLEFEYVFTREFNNNIKNIYKYLIKSISIIEERFNLFVMIFEIFISLIDDDKEYPFEPDIVNFPDVSDENIITYIKTKRNVYNINETSYYSFIINYDKYLNNKIKYRNFFIKNLIEKDKYSLFSLFINNLIEKDEIQKLGNVQEIKKIELTDFYKEIKDYVPELNCYENTINLINNSNRDINDTYCAKEYKFNEIYINHSYKLYNLDKILPIFKHNNISLYEPLIYKLDLNKYFNIFNNIDIDSKESIIINIITSLLYIYRLDDLKKYFSDLKENGKGDNYINNKQFYLLYNIINNKSKLISNDFYLTEYKIEKGTDKIYPYHIYNSKLVLLYKYYISIYFDDDEIDNLIILNYFSHISKLKDFNKLKEEKNNENRKLYIGLKDPWKSQKYIESIRESSMLIISSENDGYINFILSYDDNILKEFNNIYTKNEKYYYKNNNKYIEINIEGIKLTPSYKIKNTNNNTYINFNAVEEIIMSKNINIQNIIIKILNLFSNYYLWYNEIKNYYLIEVIDINISFKFTEDNIYLIDNNNIEYEIIQKYEFLEGIFMYNLKNGFILKNDGKQFIFLNKIKINDNQLGYWIKNEEINNIDQLSFKKDYYIIEFNYSNLFFNSNNVNDYIALFSSFIISKNNFGILFIYDIFKNIYDKELLLDIKIDIPYWYIYYIDSEDIKLTDYNIKNRENTFINIPNSKIYNNIIQEIHELQEYKLINELAIEINDLKNKTNEDKYKLTDSLLYDFLSKIRSTCIKFTIDVCRNLKIKTTNIKLNYLNNLKEYKIDLACNIYKKLIILQEQKIGNIINLYDEFYIDLYKLIYKINFNRIYDTISKFNDDDYSCIKILKIIEFIDPFVIYNKNTSKDISTIIFELTSGLFLRTDQVETLNLINDDVDNNRNSKTYEILMGKGKTSTLTPLLMLRNYFNNKFNNINIILPDHLVPSSFTIINKFSSFFKDYNINTSINQDNDKTQNINIISDTSYKLYIHAHLKKNNSLQLSNIDKKLFIFDEIDSLIDPLQSDLNIPFKEKITPHNNRILIFNIIFESLKRFYGIENIFNNSSDNIKIKKKSIIIYSTSNTDIDFANIIENKINSVLNMLLNMKINKNYGFGNYNNNYSDLTLDNYKNNQKQYFTAIPYNAVDSPLNDSQFSDYELLNMLTINLYMLTGIRNKDIELLFLFFKEKILNNEYLLDLYFDKILDLIPKEKIIEIIYLESNDKFKNECNLLVDIIKNNITFIQFYIENIIVPLFFDITLEQNNITMLDLFNPKICINKISFSGTVNFYKPCEIIDEILVNNKFVEQINESLITDIIIDIFAEGAIKASLLGITSIIPNIIDYEIKSDIEIENEFLDCFFSKIMLYDSLIDGGGLILKTKPDQIIKKIRELLPDKKILYVNEKDERVILDESGNINLYNNQKFNNVFIFYDNKHCIGTDFKQPDKMKGLVSIRYNDTLTKISQAIFRLRNINFGHSVDFYCPKNIMPERKVGIEYNDEFLYDKLFKNETKYKENTKNNYKLQSAKYIYRYIINNEISYKEELFFDLKTYNINGINKYIDKNNFFHNYIDIINSKIRKELQIKKFNIDEDSTVKIQKQVVQEKKNEKEVKKEEEKEVKKEISNNKDISNIILDRQLNESDILDISKYTMTFKSKNIFKTIKDYHLQLSPCFIDFFNLKKTTTPSWNTIFLLIDFEVYYIFDEFKNIFCITPFEYGQLYIKYDKLKEEKQCIFVCDKYGKVVWNPKNLDTIIDEIIKIYLFENNNSIIDNFHKLELLSAQEIYYKDKIFVYSTIFNIKRINNQILENINYNSFYNYNIWSNLYGITNFKILTKIINLYIHKYHKGSNLIVFDGSLYDLNKININENSDEYNIIMKIINNESISDINIKNLIILLSKISYYYNNYKGSLFLYNELKMKINIILLN